MLLCASFCAVALAATQPGDSVTLDATRIVDDIGLGLITDIRPLYDDGEMKEVVVACSGGMVRLAPDLSVIERIELEGDRRSLTYELVQLDADPAYELIDVSGTTRSMAPRDVAAYDDDGTALWQIDPEFTKEDSFSGAISRVLTVPESPSDAHRVLVWANSNHEMLVFDQTGKLIEEKPWQAHMFAHEIQPIQRADDDEPLIVMCEGSRLSIWSLDGELVARVGVSPERRQVFINSVTPIAQDVGEPLGVLVMYACKARTNEKPYGFAIVRYDPDAEQVTSETIEEAEKLLVPTIDDTQWTAPDGGAYALRTHMGSAMQPDGSFGGIALRFEVISPYEASVASLGPQTRHVETPAVVRSLALPNEDDTMRALVGWKRELWLVECNVEGD